MLARLVAVFAWTVAAMLIQSLLLLLPGRAKERFAQIYWRGMSGILGLHITVVGKLAPSRPALYVSNHSSWLDIAVLGAVLPGCFVAKAAIAHWPLFNWVAKLGRTVFVSRSRSGVSRERETLLRRLAQGDNIILFPEGTTSDGARVLPFSSAFLTLADAPQKPSVQPVTLVYDGLDGLPVRHANLPEIAWYGDMALLPHYAVLGRRWRIHATVVLDDPIPPGLFPNRKALSAALEARLARNAAALRQGRFRE